MIIDEKAKKQILEEYNIFKNSQYANKSLEERKELDQYFTPPAAAIKMIECFNCDSLENKIILDPCCGSGNLLAACILAGANPENVYGNELDKTMLELCRRRLADLCKKYGLKNIPNKNLHQGDALNYRCLRPESFTDDYKYITYEQEYLW